MPFFAETDGAPERIGKIIGEVLADLVIVAVIVLMVAHLLS
jgi:hypothetical protein